MHDWEKPHITRENGRYFFTRPISKTIGEKIDVTEDVLGWMAQAAAHAGDAAEIGALDLVSRIRTAIGDTDE